MSFNTDYNLSHPYTKTTTPRRYDIQYPSSITYTPYINDTADDSGLSSITRHSMQSYACLDLNKLGLDYGGIQKDEDRLALKRQKNREKKRRSKARKAIAKQEAKALAADAMVKTKEREDEEETAPSDTTKYDPVKAAHDFLNRSSVDQNKQEEEVKEANVDNICIGGLSIGKSELDTNEVRYSIFIVSMHKVSL